MTKASSQRAYAEARRAAKRKLVSMFTESGVALCLIYNTLWNISSFVSTIVTSSLQPPQATFPAVIQALWLLLQPSIERYTLFAVVGDEKQVQLLGMMNRLLDRHPKARQRCLAWSTPVVIPLWPNVSLLFSFCTLPASLVLVCRSERLLHHPSRK